jgi:hypothetical protein
LFGLLLDRVGVEAVGLSAGLCLATLLLALFGPGGYGLRSGLLSAPVSPDAEPASGPGNTAVGSSRLDST